MSTHRSRLALYVWLAAIALGLGSLTIRAQQAPDKDFPKDLGGQDRKLLHLATDKPYYRAGEVVYVRGLLLDAFTRAPAAGSITAQIEVKSPKGDVVLKTPLLATEAGGTLAYAWPVPPGQPGGEYKVVCKMPWNGYPEAEVAFQVRSYRVPRLKTQLDLGRKAYGPGEEVVATLVATRAEGGIPAGAKVTAVARVDGAEVHRGLVALDVAGGAVVRFKLPAEIATGEGSLACTIEDGGVVETAAKTLPIVVAALRLDVYPEGGDLVSGVASRLYIEARTPLGEPADVAGRIVDYEKIDLGPGESGLREGTVARFRTEHEGRGRSDAFVPEAGKRYAIVVDEPAGVKERFRLPAVAAEGVVLQTLDDVVAAHAPLRVRVAAAPLGPSGRVRVLVSRIEREVARFDLELPKGEARELSIPLTGEGSDGVLRVTALDPATGKPWAERLVFRRPARALHLDVVADPARTTPRGVVSVKVRATDASTGEPVEGAIVVVSAVDDAVLETIEKRERAPRLPVQVLLEGEVRELKDAHVYLGAGPEAARALDLLLATQGWRRFALVDAEKFWKEHGAAAARALAVRFPPDPVLELAGAAGAEGGDREFDGAPMERREGGGRPRPGRAIPPPAPAPAGAPPELPKAREAAATPPAGDPKMPEVASATPADKPMAGEELGVLVEEERKLRRDEAGRRRGPLAYIREYAHEVRTAAPAGVRIDFTETVYWNAGARTGKDGTFALKFQVPDSVTSFRVRADGVSAAGALGEGDALVLVRKPFYLEPKLPLEVTAGDRIDAPVAVANGTNGRLEVSLQAASGNGLKLGLEGSLALALDPEGRGRVYVPLVVGAYNGEVAVRVAGAAGAEKDDVVRRVAVVPAGFPVEMAFGGRIEPGQAVKHTVRIAESVEPTSVRGQASVYPSPLASLTEAVAALLREPHGCFEQTSATSYPNVMVMRYVASHPGADAALVAKAADLLDRGYKRLVGFECKQGGYEWFGGDPGHEALTAYGLLQYTDMAAVYPVDPAMVARTRDWLLARRDGKGGFERNSRALDSFGAAPQDVTDLYITWALTEAQVAGLEKEIASARARGQGANDPYVIALAANILLNAKDDAAGAVLDRLVPFQAEDGHVKGAATSITRSSGYALEVETTSLALLAWMRSPAHTARVEKGMQWLLERCKAGSFGPTQSTILALRAVLAYDAAHATPKAPGTLLLSIDGQVVDEVPFGPDRQGPIHFPGFVDRLKPGMHEVELKMVGGSSMPYSLVVDYHAAVPASSPACKVRLEAALGKKEVREGETVDLSVKIANATGEGLPMTVAIVGLPGGLEARPERLKELVKAGEIDAFETRGREVVFYLRQMKPGEAKALTIDCAAAIPGTYTGPASRAYLYYSADDVQWVPGLGVTVHRP